MTNLLGEAFVAIRPEFRQFEGELTRRASQAADQASRQMHPIEPKIDVRNMQQGLLSVGNIARTVAGTVIVVAFKKAIDAGEAYAASIRKIAALTGESTEETSKLVFALQRVGINENLASRSLIAFNRNLSAGSKGIRQYFSAAQIAELRTKSFAEQLPILAAAFQDLEKGAARTNFLRALFGFTGVREFGKLLSLTTEELKELGVQAELFGLILTDKNVEAFKKFTESTRALDQAQKGLQVQIAQATIPFLQKLNEIATDVVVKIIGINDAAKNAVGGLAVLGTGVAAVIGPVDTLVNVITNSLSTLNLLKTRRIASAAASAAETTATVAETAAHGRATGAILLHAKAEDALLLAHLRSTAAASDTALLNVLRGAGAKGGGLFAGGFKAGIGKLMSSEVPALLAGSAGAIGAAAVPLGVTVAAGVGTGIGLAAEQHIIRPLVVAAEEGSKAADAALNLLPVAKLSAAAGRIAGGERNPLKALFPSLADINETEQAMIDLVAVLERAGEIDELGAAEKAIKGLKEEGKLTEKAMDAIFGASGLKKIRDTAESGGDVGKVIAEIAAAANDGKDSVDELGATVGDFIGDLQAMREAQIKTKGEQAQLNQALRVTGVETEAGQNVLANYAQSLFLAAQAAAKASGVEFDAAKARKDAAAAALEAGQDFIENEKRIAEAAEEGRERIADAEKELAETIKDSRDKIIDAQEDYAEAIEDRNERIADAEKDLAETIKDTRERIAAAEERVNEARENGAESIADARERLKEAELTGAQQIIDAEKRLKDARRARRQAILDGTLAVEAAQRAGDAEAEASARLALQRTKQDQSVKEAELSLRETRQDAIKAEADAREDLAKTIRDTNESIKDAEKDLADARVEAAEAVADAEKHLADTVKEANKAVADAAENLIEAQQDAAEAIQEAHEAVKKAQEDAAKAIRDLTGDIEGAIDAYNRLREAALASGEGESLITGHATVTIASNQHGGRLRAGELSFVGERGVELFAPDQNGQVISNDVLVRFLRALEKSGTNTGKGDMNITVHESSDPEATIAMLKNRLLMGVF